MQCSAGSDAGVRRIVARSVGSQVVLSELASSYPLKLLSPRSTHSNVGVVYVLTYGGGLVAGDQVKLQAEVLDGAVLVLLTQGSTKVFKARPGGRSARPTTMVVDDTTSQIMDVVVDAKSAIFLLPDPVACFRAAKYAQEQTLIFHLSLQSSAVLLDWITAGRKSLGEDWSFSKYPSLNEIFVEGQRIARDALLLEDLPSDAKPLPDRRLSDRLKPYSCYATVLMYGPLTDSTRRTLKQEHNSITLYKYSAPPELTWSLTSISDDKGCIVRVAATEMEAMRNWLKESLHPLTDVVGIDTYRNAFG